MYLKSIKAYGFKSFADKIEINLGENINGIVGPNGSGKSNVVDAVRWVLGEQSVKSLRGESSTDVIFSGSKSRKALNSASVTLVFDNSDLYLPINYTEVSVKRVMYRTGENEYYLNGEKCRLKDINELLTDTGADKESFNIISQGKIDEILSTKPEDRRTVFESAAGVLKYKKRKIEALKKLERTNANINRVNDILKELESNLTPLESQSKDATTYLDTKDELTNLEVSLLVHDITNLNEESSNLKVNIDNLKDEIVKLSNDNSSYDIDVLTKKDELKELESEITEKQSLLIECTKNIERIDANIRMLKERRKYLKDNESQSNLIDLKEELLKINNQISEVNLRNDNYNDVINDLNHKLESVLDLKEEKEKEKLSIQNKLDDCNRQRSEISYRIDYLEESIQNSNLVPAAVKNVLNNKRLEGIHDIIGNLIEVDEEYVLAINTALGGAVNYLVSNTSEDAKEVIKYLRDNHLGRATIFPIDTIKPRLIDDTVMGKIKKMTGFVDIASNLVSNDSLYDNIINNQLGNVIVTDNIDNANYLSKSISARYKVVTLDGQIVNVGGSLTGGSSKQTNNILKERYELDEKKRELDSLLVNVKNLKEKITLTTNDASEYDNSIFDYKTKILEYQELVKQNNTLKAELEQRSDYVTREIKDIEVINNEKSDTELENMLNMYYSAIGNKDNVTAEINNLRVKKENLEEVIKEIEGYSKQSNVYIGNAEKNLKELEIKYNTINVKLDNSLITLGDEYNLTYEGAKSKYYLDMPEGEVREKVRTLKDIIKNLGYVNVGAIEEYKRVKERYDFLTGQSEDLKKAEDTLLEILNEMDKIMKEKFSKTFEQIRIEFKKVFKEMFGGGEAELVLTDPNNLLETGIEIEAVPTGKNLKSLSLLSGGEKTFTAISLLFAILNVRPVPFCLLDEVEAALDDANVESFGNYLFKYKNKTQFILITHKKKTMEFADILYGITMQESGVSKLVSVRLEDIEKSIN